MINRRLVLGLPLVAFAPPARAATWQQRLVAGCFRQWQTQAANRIWLRSVMQRMVARWSNRAVFGAFRTWRENTLAPLPGASNVSWAISGSGNDS